MNSNARKFVRSLKRKGWSWEYHGSGHIRLTSPDGKTVTMASTPSDRRALKNVMADVRRISVRGMAIGERAEAADR